MILRTQFRALVHFKMLFILVALVSCAEDYQLRDTTTLINSDLSGLLFQKGSLWIYKDSISGKVDTTIISDSKEKYLSIQSSQSGKHSYQVYSMTFENFIDGKQSQIDAARYALYYNYQPPSDFNWFFYPFEITRDETIKRIRPRGFILNYTLGSRTFPKVYVLEHDSLADQNSGTFHRVYVSDSFGLVQYTLYRNNKMYKNSKLVQQNLIRFRLN